MNAKMKRRLGVVTGVIAIVLILMLSIVGSNSAARTVSVAEALEVSGDAKIQVTGNVAENSFDIEGNVLTFKVYDPEADPKAAHLLDVRYDGGVSATFGNDVTAICTGKKNAEGVLNCSELVTKCPSKYERVEGSLTVAELIGYGDAVLNKPVKVSGTLKAGSLTAVDAAERFIIVGGESEDELHVKYDGALSGDISEGATVVLTGSIGANGLFTATDVALQA